jgi:hypothetical protein
MPRVTDRHGDTPGVDLNVWLGDDPELALVTADMDAWDEAHPCECDALCECPEAQ